MQVVGAIAEHVIPVEDDGEDGRDWLNQHELEHALLHTTVENPTREQDASQLDQKNEYPMCLLTCQFGEV